MGTAAARIRAAAATLAAAFWLTALPPAAAQDAPPGERALKSFASVMDESCPVFGERIPAAMLRDPRRAEMLGKLNLRALQHGAARYRDAVLQDGAGPLPEAKRREADEAVMAMTGAYAGWIQTLWADLRRADADRAPQTPDAHPLAAPWAQAEAAAGVIAAAAESPAGDAWLAPLAGKVEDCFVRLQNRVAKAHEGAISGRLSRAPEAAARRAVLAAFAPVDFSFSTRRVAPDPEVEKLFAGMIAPPRTASKALRRALEEERAVRRAALVGAARATSVPKKPKPVPAPAPAPEVKKKPSPAPPAVTDAERVQISKAFLSAVWDRDRAGAGRHLTSNVTMRTPQSRASGRSSVASKMISGFAKYRPSVSTPRAGGGGTVMNVRVGNRRGRMTFRFSGKLIRSISQ